MRRVHYNSMCIKGSKAKPCARVWKVGTEKGGARMLGFFEE